MLVVMYATAAAPMMSTKKMIAAMHKSRLCETILVASDSLCKAMRRETRTPINKRIAVTELAAKK